MLLCIVYAMLFVDMKIKACIALNATFVDTVDTGVCGFYTTLYRDPCLESTVSTYIVLMV